MNLEVKDLTAKIVPVFSFLKRYVVVIFFVILCTVYGFLTFRINSLIQAEPDPTAVSEKLQTVPRPRVDQAAIDKMRELEEENVEVKALFDEARSNPFSE